MTKLATGSLVPSTILILSIVAVLRGLLLAAFRIDHHLSINIVHNLLLTNVRSGGPASANAQHNTSSEWPQGKPRPLVRQHSGSGGALAVGVANHHAGFREAAHLLRNDSVIPREVATELEEELDMLPDFQRISISGEDTSGVSVLPISSLPLSCWLVLKAFMIDTTKTDDVINACCREGFSPLRSGSLLTSFEKKKGRSLSPSDSF